MALDLIKIGELKHRTDVNEPSGYNPPLKLSMPENHLAINPEMLLARAAQFCWGLVEGAHHINPQGNGRVCTTLYSATAAEYILQRLCPEVFRQHDDCPEEQKILALQCVEAWIAEARAEGLKIGELDQNILRWRADTSRQFLELLSQISELSRYDNPSDIGEHLIMMSVNAGYSPDSFGSDERDNPVLHAKLLKKIGRAHLEDISVALGDPRYICYLVTDGNWEDRKAAATSLNDFITRANEVTVDLNDQSELDRYNDGIKLARRVWDEFSRTPAPVQEAKSHLD